MQLNLKTKVFKSQKSRRLMPAIIIIGISVIGISLLSLSHAASPYTSTEAATGTLSSPAAIVQDSSAVDGQSVQFGTYSSSSGSSNPVPTDIPGNWNIQFDDEFNGTSLDLTKWIPTVGGSDDTSLKDSADSPTVYDPSHVTEANGYLQLTATDQSENGETYTSGGVWTGNGLFSIAPTASKPVAVEARIYLPAASAGVIANWPAFWMAGTNWPEDGEIDVMEGLGGTAQYHFHYGTEGDEGSEGDEVPGDYTGWHTYGAVWTTSSVTFYYDGQDVGEITQGITDEPMPIIVNLAVAADGGPVVTPSTMLVDYVRAWN